MPRKSSHAEPALEEAAASDHPLVLELPVEEDHVQEQQRAQEDAGDVEGEEDVEQDVARVAIADRGRGRLFARRDRDDAERDDDPERRQGCGAHPRANLHRRVRRPSVEERLHRPAVVGIVNVTPDSFSDGGVHLDPDVAASAARRMLADGAQLVDVGGESTRPGSGGVSLDEELRRVLPVLERLEGLPISIDTAKAEVARRALALGAELVNDVTALRGDPELAGVVADAGAYLCLMHMRGEPRTMQDDPRYEDVASEVTAFLESRLAFAVSAGIPEERVCLDPGIGFGKTPEQNFELVRRLDVLLALGRPVLVGLSRKSSLGKLFDAEARTGSLAASLGAAVAAYERGASIFRVHDVREHVEALTAAAAVGAPA